MNKITLIITALLISTISYAQQEDPAQEKKQEGHYNISKFQQLKQELTLDN